MRIAVSVKRYACAVLFCAFASPALAGEAVLVNGANGEYWGLSAREITAKAPGTAVGTINMDGMVILEYADTVKNVPVTTGYTLKNDQCWKITVEMAATDAAASASVRALYDEAVAEISKILGEPVESPPRMVFWNTEKTTSLLFADLNNPDKAQLTISFELPVLSETMRTMP